MSGYLDNFASAVYNALMRMVRVGRVGKLEPDGTTTINVAVKPHFIYVSLGSINTGAEVIEAYNSGAPRKAGTPVLVFKWNRVWRILSVDIDSPGVDKYTYPVAYHEHGTREGLPQHFLKLDGMPNEFGEAGQVLVVNTPRDKMYFADPPPGDTGPEGPPGPSGGMSVRYKFDVATSGDPGSGHIRLSNVDLTAVLSMNISDLDDNGADLSTWISFIGTSVNDFSGYIDIHKDATNFRIYGVYSAAVDNTTYWTIGIVHLGGMGSFSDEDNLDISFTRSGDDGIDGGTTFQYAWLTTTTDTDPLSGNMRGNNATFASITRLFIDDEEEVNATDVQTWLASFDDSNSTIRGQIKITKRDAHEDFMLFNVNGDSIEEVGYWKILVDPILQVGDWSTGNIVTVSFSRTGDKGDAADIVAETLAASTDDTIDDADVFGRVSGVTWVKTTWANIKAVLTATALTWSALQTFTANILVALASAKITINATTGNPALFLQENGTDKWKIEYSPANNRLTITEVGVADSILINDGGQIDLRRSTTGILLTASDETLTESAEVFPTGFKRESDASVRFGLILNAATSAMMYAGVVGDTFRRLLIRADGQLLWGSGAATRDTNLYRSAANSLKTDDSFEAVGRLKGGILNLSAASTVISAGAITFTKSWTEVDTEASAATDDLDTINGGSDGDIVILHSANSARDVVIKNGTGNIVCGADITLTSNRDTLMLIYHASPAVWLVAGNLGNNA